MEEEEEDGLGALEQLLPLLSSQDNGIGIMHTPYCYH